MKLIYRTLLLNKVCAQGSGATAAQQSDWRWVKVCSDMKFIKQPLFWPLFNVFDFFSFQIVNREKRRFLERTGRFYAFTFGISQKSAVLI